MAANKKSSSRFKWPRRIFLGLLGLFVIWFLIGVANDAYNYWDDDVYAAAIPLMSDPIDAPVNEIRYLEQGWKPAQSLWFYNATQGSNLLPYDFFLHLEQADSEELFRSERNINYYRYLPQNESFSNPDGLPVGMAKDKYKGKSYLGFTCAACHTNQVNFNGVGIRIDGGPTAADMDNFLKAMASALEATRDNEDKRQRFHDSVLEGGDYDSGEDIDTDLDKWSTTLRAYTLLNDPVHCVGSPGGQVPKDCEKAETVHYGYARLDAFGRIYNRVLEHVLDSDRLRVVLQESLPAEAWETHQADIENILNGKDQTHLFQRAMVILQPYIQENQAQQEQIVYALRRKLFNPASAPASYPFLWDISQHDFVQWTGLVTNAGLGPLGRNVGQVIGVFGTLDWQVKPQWRIWSVLGGQGLGDSHVDFESSIDKRNLRRVETLIRKLESPQWPGDVLGEPDENLKKKGKKLFQEYCASCHANIVRDDPERRVIAHMGHVDSVGTDPVLASNAIAYSGYTGIIEHYYADTNLGKIVLQKSAPLAPMVSFSTVNVVVTPDADKNKIRRAAEWLYDTAKSFFDNKVKASLKQGDYTPATTNDPFAPLYAYKGRSLNGIWATAPYLHNGSVPTLYHLLLPKRDGDEKYAELYHQTCGKEPQYRPDTFLVGSREFDTVKVGFRYQGYDPGGDDNFPFVFDSGLPGNANTGHEYAAGRTAQADGRTLKPLCSDERKALVEYLKTL